MNGICHVEIPCSSTEKAKKFFNGVFGWEMSDMPGMEGYTLFKPQSGPGGGFSTQMKVAQGGILFHVEVEDIEAMLKKVESAGGKTVKGKTQITPEIGHFAIFTDPDGNQIGLFAQK
jgi:hypothetical protein